ncbi:MAG: SDR family oxidoreductase [Myxococcaceae bacterium]
MSGTVFAPQILKNKVAFVTGGGSGINLSIAHRFAENGASVVLLGRSAERLEKAAEGLRSQGATVRTFSADVRDFGAVDAAMQETAKAMGAIDILVCGAAGNFPAPAVGLSSNGFRAVVDIDLVGTFHAARAAFEHFRKPGATMLAISAPQAYLPTPMQAHVCAAKAGVDMLVQTLAYEWGGAGVRVNSLVPGPIDDTEGMRRLAPTPEGRDAVVSAIPLGRMGSKDEVADAALFLCSDAARFVTGTVLRCDGGQSLGGSAAFLRGMGLV